MNGATSTSISLHAAATAGDVALCAGIAVVGDGAPEWIQLLPAGEIRTNDERGPYRVADPAALCTTSLKAGERLIIDENHSTDLLAPKGGSAPARGWIVALETRDGSVWGKVEWTPEGRDLVSGRAYRGISPTIIHDGAKRVIRLLRASLVNVPNLRDLATLHQENALNLLQKLAAQLGLATDTSEEALLVAVTALHQAQADQSTALQSQLAPIAKAAGVAETSDVTTVLQAVTTLKAGAGGTTDAVKALQTELVGVTTELNAMKTDAARTKATAFIDQAIRDKRVGVSSLRDHYIARHMTDAAAVEKEVAALPMLGRSHTEIQPPTAKPGELAGEHKSVAQLLGIDPEKMKATLAAEGQSQTSF